MIRERASFLRYTYISFLVVLIYNTQQKYLCPRRDSNPPTPASDEPQTVALESSTTGIDKDSIPGIVQPVASRYTD